MDTLIYVGIVAVCFIPTHAISEEFTDRFTLRIAEHDQESVQRELTKHGIRFMERLMNTPDYYVFYGGRNGSDTDLIPMILESSLTLKTKVKSFERIRRYRIESFDSHVKPMAVFYEHPTPSYDLPNCPTFSDMGVEAVWKMGYTGKGVVIAITDAGINTDIPDLIRNISPELSFNFVANNTDVTPERCYDSDHYSLVSDHGNKCAGVVGALKNNVCGDGVAFEASIAAYKIFNVNQNPINKACSLYVVTLWIAQGFVHQVGKVGVFSNSWSAAKPFTQRSALVSNALQTGVNKGRNGKGAIYVFPVGPLADPYANSVHTIAVNSVGSNGHVSSFSEVCACTLTSALGESNKNGPCTLHTTSYEGDRCTVDFEGTDAATAIVSGIIGLALHANPQLSWRDIQDLIVQASDSTHLANHNYFQVNGAGHRYDPVLGFGLLNAAKLVALAKTAKPLPDQLTLSSTKFTVSRRRRQDTSNPYVTCTLHVPCNETCIKRVESVTVQVSYWSLNENQCELILTSPSGTNSLLMNRKQSGVTASVYRKDIAFRSVNFWGEPTEGNWTLSLLQRHTQGDIKIEKCKIKVYGTGFTKNPPLPTNPPDTGLVYERGYPGSHGQHGYDAERGRGGTSYHGPQRHDTPLGVGSKTILKAVAIAIPVVVILIIAAIIVILLLRKHQIHPSGDV